MKCANPSALITDSLGVKMPTWNPSDRDAAISRGKSGGRLTDFERRKLEEARRQAGSTGQQAKEALQKQK